MKLRNFLRLLNNILTIEILDINFTDNIKIKKYF